MSQEEAKKKQVRIFEAEPFLLAAAQEKDDDNDAIRKERIAEASDAGQLEPKASLINCELPDLPSSDASAYASVHQSQSLEPQTITPAARGAGGAALPALKALSKLKDSLLSVALPLSLLVIIGLYPKFLIVWIAVIVLKPVCQFLYARSPDSWRQSFRNHLPPYLRNSPALQEVSDGAELGLPFVLFFIYLAFAPFAIGWIFIDWLRSFFPEKAPEQKDCFVLTQNKRLHPVHAETNFYNSRAFSLVILAFFALGIPAFCSYSIFEKLGVEKMLSAPIAPIPAKYMENTLLAPAPTIPKQPQVLAAPQGSDATVVQGYNGSWPWLANYGIAESKRSFFLLHFYLFSLATALSVLFFRSWFTFPLNFAANEYDVELSESGIRRNNFKSWFRSLLTLNGWATGDGPNRLSWASVKSLRYWQDGGTKLCPLPETIFKRESLSYKLLNKLAAFFDGLTNSLKQGKYLVFSTVESGSDFGRHVKVNLKNLSREQKARLFHSAKTWAPHLHIPQGVEQELLGSAVLREAKYTELWFDLLNSASASRKCSQATLLSGELLCKGRYKIDNYLASGGQANVYLACDQQAEPEKRVVLKEFILSGSSSSGAFLESARDFESELSLLSQLNHPGIVKLLDFFSENGRVYAVLEQIEGQSLRDLVKQSGALSEKQVIELAIAVCEILEYLHQQTPPVVHRDISPENLIFTPAGKVKLIDFSLAVRKDESTKRTDSCAKQCFTPTEQFRGEINPQSDIYALGATMFFLLSGELPKPISTSSPKNKKSSISEPLNEIVEQATQLDLTKRYESVKWMKLDLMKLL